MKVPTIIRKLKENIRKTNSLKRNISKREKTDIIKRKDILDIENPFSREITKEKNPKECRCYYCKEIGHYANRCPKKFSNNSKKIEIDEDIEEMINLEEFIELNNFEEVESDDIIFILTNTDYYSSSEDSQLEDE